VISLSLEPIHAEDFIPEYISIIRKDKILRDRLAEICHKFLLDLHSIFETMKKTALRLCLNKPPDIDPLEYAISCLYIASSLTCKRYFGVIVISKEEILDILGGSITLFHENCRRISLNLPKLL
jgi:hypothetical protein